MRLRSSFRPSAPEAAAIFANLLVASAQNFTEAPSPNLDLSQLGRIALTGDFDSISTYSYVGQNEDSFTTNGTQGLLSQLPNGVITTLAASDATITAMCPFVRKNGDLAGIVVGGNFTMLKGTQAQGVALWDPSSDSVTPLPGLSGSVSAVYCDQDTDSVYVGGAFHGGNSTNAIVWLGMAGWSNMPFAGFNGPVNAITKSPDGNIIFGGSFSVLGNTTTPAIKNGQTINLGAANITAGPPATDSQFNDPKSILCKTDDTDGPGSTWLTADNGGGYYRADFNLGFEPTKLRLYNTHYQGRGAKTFRFTAFPINGIMNFTYFNPDTNQNESCTNACPLSQNPSVKSQDFQFVNAVGMDSFQIDFTAFYGQSAGLDGIELFQDDIYAFAVPSLNEPACSVGEFPSNSTSTGPWQVTPSGLSGSEFLTASLQGPNVNENSAQVVFQPDIQESGEYVVTIYTPGCQQDNSCQKRGIANVTGLFSADGTPVTKQVYQTNDFDKYDQIFSGQVDASSSSFKPTVTLSPLSSQGSSTELVALKVRFQLLSSNGTASSSSGSSDNSTTLNGLFEYDPTQAFSTDFANNKVDAAGSALSEGAIVSSLAVIGQTTYVSGNFTNSNYNNIFAMTNGQATSLPGGGLNHPVAATFAWENLLFVGGNFTNTVSITTGGLNNVAVYDTGNQSWGALGTGVNGPVSYIVPLQMNITGDTPETVITVNGQFTQVLTAGGKPAFSVTSGLAIWVPSHNDWLQNIGTQTPSIRGSLTTATNVTGEAPLLAGTINSQGWALTDAVSLSTDGNGNVDIAPIGLTVQDSSSATTRKRDLSTQSFNGAITGLFDTDNGQNLTVLAGHFQATASDGTKINNLAILNATSDGSQGVSGLGSGVDTNSTFRVVSRNGTMLAAGGEVTGKIGGNPVGGIVLWDLSANDFATQPPALTGSNVSVLALATQPGSNDLYVGGQFDQAGALPCASLCVYSNGEWNAPGSGLSGTVTQLLWQSNSQLLVTGNLTVSGNQTSLATYNADSSSQAWSIPDGADVVPGPVTALASASSDNSQYWVSGLNSKDGSAYLIMYDGTKFNTVDSLFDPNTAVQGLSVVTMSQAHGATALLTASLSLMLTGNINIPGFGNASAVLFNGTDLTPLILTNSGNKPGTLSQVVTEMSQNFSSEESGMPVGYIVAIALAIALGIMFLLVALGFLIERRRRKAEGYRPAPQNYFEKTANMGRIPPERLFSSLNPSAGPRV